MVPSLRIPIWLQLSIAVALIIMIIVLTFSLGMLNRQRMQLYKQSVKIGKVSLNYFANNAPIPLLENDVVSLNNLLKEATSVDGILYAFILNNEGVIQAHSNLDNIGKTYVPIFDKQNLIQENGTTHFNYDLPSGENALNMNRPVEFGGKRLGEVHVGISTDFIEDVIYQETKTILRITFFVLLAGVLVAVYLGIRFTEPISLLLKATGEITRGNYKHKVYLRRKDEFGNLAAAFNHMSDELWTKSLMKESFGKYVGSEILDMILKSPERNWLKGQKNEATVLFADIRGFTAYSEQNNPEKVVEELNEFFEIATGIIQKHKGYVDKFIGDAVLGVFGVPLYYGDHEKKALLACMEMQQMFKKMGGARNRLLELVGISVNSGLLVSGNIGSQAKMEYTVIGDTVNMASRMNSLANAGEVIISKAIFEKLENTVETLTLPPASIKGKSGKIQVYKVIKFKESGKNPV